MPANKASQIEHQLSSVQFSSVPSSVGSSEDMTDMNDEFIRDSLPVFSAGGPCEQFWHGQGCPLFDVVHPAICLPKDGVARPPKCSEGWVSNKASELENHCSLKEVQINETKHHSALKQDNE